MRFINRKTLAIAGAAVALVAVGSTGTAVAGSLIGSADIEDGSIRSVDIKDGKVKLDDLSPRFRRCSPAPPGRHERAQRHSRTGRWRPDQLGRQPRLPDRRQAHACPRQHRS